ncbi:uncharacterized protein EKO05_0008873 [Ascochyta rabiei]|uniref:Uncharacterized protein n=1 Tax=Didymella rabiei TaxID=5454 RepID=A0A163ARX9_DIDRA|nr:uncharacterized protein EKO05_0008873 [Ascochyta rabiei]KZM21349.1 hypothetical protein ST47_g7505 [Ascochyta rabiei]UPX18579.1 hypothetical protein EKO05_0008873 [Ascochyta rabiei]
MEEVVDRLGRVQAEDVEQDEAWEAADLEASVGSQPSNSHRRDGSPDVRQQGAPVPFRISRRLASGCRTPGCNRTTLDGLSRCTGCRVALYCGREHQHADRPAHKEACSAIKKANLAYEKAERELCDKKGDDVLRQELPRFWNTGASQPYMRARFALVESLLLVNTETAVGAALDHVLAMLQLSRRDTMGMRDVVPALFLRLRRDQQAYDFCKWWVTAGRERDYGWADKTSRYLDTQDADVFEDPRAFVRDATVSLSLAVSVTLVKLRLLMDLLALQRDRQIAAPKLPSEITDQGFVHCTSSIIQSQRRELEREEQTLNTTMLRKHVAQLFAAVRQSNAHFWPALLRPGSHLEARPVVHGLGDTGQMQVVLRANHQAWAETKGAMEAVEELLQS